ncbi:PAS domain-containing protein, partial [Roseisolibacter sp. H3M3-2]|uniref:hybrid sensor histidine kinase/response regulator n=1 Tax=Roseisolibacter sp. H3M3-2 TaxID=3031323 RepID=UPI0023DA19DA
SRTVARGAGGGALEVRAVPAGDALLVTVGAADEDPLDREAAATLDRLPDVVLRYDRDGVVRYVNAAIEAATGRPPAHFLGRPAAEAEVDPAISARFAEARAHVFATGEAATFAIARRGPDGAARHVEYRMLPERASCGTVATAVAIGRDVTEQVALHDALRESERRLATLLANIPGIAYRVREDAAWSAEFVSEGTLALTGHPAAAFGPGGGVTFEALIHPDDRARVRAAIGARLDAGEPFQVTYRMRRADGGERWVWEHGREVPGAGGGGPRVLEGLIVDVTDREEARRALEAERARLEESQRLAHVGSWEWDLRTDAVTWSDELYRIAGLPRDVPPTLDRFAALVHPEDLDRVLATLREGMSTGRTVELEHRIARPDEAAVTVYVRARMVTDATGRVVRLVGSVQDVTEHRAAQAALRLSQEQQVALLQNIPDAAWLKDVHGRYVALNEAAWRARGLGAAEVLGRTAADIFAPEVVAGRLAHDRAVLESGRPLMIEHRETGPDGAPRWYETVKAPYYDADGAVAGTVGIARDITERRRLEEQLRHSQKMDALGLLAGSVAHDFNNLLSAIIGGAELARLEAPDGTQLARDLDDVRSAAQRGAQLTRQLLAFSRTQVSQPRRLDLRDVVRDSAKLLRRLLPDDVGLDLAVEGDPVVAQADPGQLEQVLMNLVVNARDAVLAARERVDGDARAERADVVTLGVERLALRAGDARLARPAGAPLPAGTYAALVVRDTGAGMDADTRARIFEPFFTTKPQGRGTGLGLATVLAIVAQGGGTVHAESAPDAGATFTVLLPPAKGGAEVVTAGTRPSLPGGTETVLLVEDEAVVRETATRLLQRYGYRVLATRHGGDALLAWAEHREAVALLITDLRMPAMDGPTLVARLRAERPGLPVLVMSGYSLGRDEAERALLEDAHYLAKPFTADTLLPRVRAALDGAPTATSGAAAG